jgi:hypothetical protein
MRAATFLTLTAAVAAAVACVPAFSARAAAPTCSTISTALVKSALGIAVQPTASSSTSSFGGHAYLDCAYGSGASTGASIEYISPYTSAGWSSLQSMLKKAAEAKTVAGIGTGAFSGTGSSTIASNTPGGKTKMTTVTTENLWVYVNGKAIFEISVPKGNLMREEALAKKMVPLV